MQNKLKHTIAGTLMLLAITVWLVHAIVPHHHHDTSVCFINQHCHPNEAEDTGSPGNDCSGHGHDHGVYNCSLNQSATVPQYAVKFLSFNDRTSDDEFSSCPIQAVISYFRFAPPSGIKSSPKYLTEGSLIFCDHPNGHIHGLRAPPTA